MSVGASTGPEFGISALWGAQSCRAVFQDGRFWSALGPLQWRGRVAADGVSCLPWICVLCVDTKGSLMFFPLCAVLDFGYAEAVCGESDYGQCEGTERDPQRAGKMRFWER